VVVVSYSGKEINAKLVYYGAGLSGKTTNLESIYEAVPETSRGKMVSMKTQSDRTLFFDLLPLDLGEIMGFKTRFLLYTVPGQVFYNATRKLVLKGADAVVFVADSEIGKMEENRESLQNLRTNLSEYGLRLEEIPWVIQYNKRDLENRYSVEELNAQLNPDGSVPHFEAVANQGKGVFETFRGVSHLLMENVTRDLRRAPVAGGTRSRGEPAPHGRTDPPHAIPSITTAPSHSVAPAQMAQAGSPNEFEYGRDIAFPAEAQGSQPANPMLPTTDAENPLDLQLVSGPNQSLGGRRGAPLLSSPGARKSDSELATLVKLSATHSDPRLGIRDSKLEESDAVPENETVIPISLPRGATREILLRIVITDGN
jgi:signal recognition particle receptor subunit beta